MENSKSNFDRFDNRATQAPMQEQHMHDIHNMHNMHNMHNSETKKKKISGLMNFMPWFGIAFSGLAALMYIITMIAGNTVPLNITMFILALIGVVFSVINILKKKNKWSDWNIISALILGGFLTIILVIGQIKYWSAASQTKNTNKKNSTTTSQTTSADDLNSKDIDVQIGQFNINEKDGMKETSLPITVTNKTDTVKMVDFEIEATDKDGNNIYSEPVMIDSVEANQSKTQDALKDIDAERIDMFKDAQFKAVNVHAV